jgi:Cof subfamily protein (haloacid dehalogenase superfamily)
MKHNIPIDLIGIDLDRTLLDNRRQLSAANTHALQECIDNGLTIAVCSGRDLPATRAITGTWEFPTWLLMQNGSLVMSPDGDAVEIRRFTRGQADRVLNVLQKHKLAPVVYDVHPRSDHVWWQKDAVAAPGVLDFRREHGTIIEMVEDVRTLLDSEISHMEVFGSQAEIFDAVDEFSDDPEVSTIPNISTSSPDRAFMGIYPAGVAKEAALERLAERLNVDQDRVLAIGDNLNDVGMVLWAGVGVMVENGPAEARETADWIAPSNNESGVAAAIDRFVFGRGDGETP